MKPSINMMQVSQQPKARIDKVELFQKKLLQYLKNDKEPSIEELRERTGFDEVDLEKIKPAFRRPILAALAAFEENFHVNEKLKQSLFFKAIQPINDALKSLGGDVTFDKLALKPDDGVKKRSAVAAAVADRGILLNPDSINSSDSYFDPSGWDVNVGEGMPSEIRTVLNLLSNFIHESGHQHESCLADQCLNDLPDETKSEMRKQLGLSDVTTELGRIGSDDCQSINCGQSIGDLVANIRKKSKKVNLLLLMYKLRDNRYQFAVFVFRKFMQYAMEQTERKYGEKPIAGLLFQPGGKLKSLSRYGSTSAAEFYAELFAQVLLTHPEYLTPLGKTLRTLLNSDHSDFRKWFRDGFTLEEYEAYKKYCAEHNGYEKCPQLPTPIGKDILYSTESLGSALEPFGFVGDTSGIKMGEIRFAIQFKLISNYNIAWSEEQARKLQTKLANAVTILAKMRKWDDKDEDAQRVFTRCREWQEAKQKSLFMSEYCDCADPDFPDAQSLLVAEPYSWLYILETLSEKDPKDFKTPEACEKFLDEEIAAVKQEIVTAQAQRAQKQNSKRIEYRNPAKKSSDVFEINPHKNRKEISVQYLSGGKLIEIRLTEQEKGSCCIPADKRLIEMAKEAGYQSGYSDKLLKAVIENQDVENCAVDYLIYKLKPKGVYKKDGIQVALNKLRDRNIYARDLENLDRPSMAKVILAAKKCGIKLDRSCQESLISHLQRRHIPLIS